jgi:hypothetical protein
MGGHQGASMSSTSGPAGAAMTFVVLLDIIQTKFLEGAWMVLLTLPLLVLLLDRTNRAYVRERDELEVEEPELLAHPGPATRSWSWSTGWTGLCSEPCSTPASSTRCRPPPCTSPPTRTASTG